MGRKIFAFENPRVRVDKALAKRYSQLEPTQANSSQVSNLDGIGYSLATHLDRFGLNLMKLKCSPNSSQVFQRLGTSANSRQIDLLLTAQL